jgi:hypothetical protein
MTDALSPLAWFGLVGAGVVGACVTCESDVAGKKVVGGHVKVPAFVGCQVWPPEVVGGVGAVPPEVVEARS